jgi:hypothetical protein
VRHLTGRSRKGICFLLNYFVCPRYFYLIRSRPLAVRTPPLGVLRGNSLTLFSCGSSDPKKMACCGAPNPPTGASPAVGCWHVLASAASQIPPIGGILATALRPTETRWPVGPPEKYMPAAYTGYEFPPAPRANARGQQRPSTTNLHCRTPLPLIKFSGAPFQTIYSNSPKYDFPYSKSRAPEI